jgi:hypothetical protein
MAPKQSLEKSALILAPVCGVLIGRGCSVALVFYFKTGADKLVNLIRDYQVTLAELSINVIARISIPNEAYDL